MDIDDLIEMFNDGDDSFIRNYFNDIDTFFKVLKKRGRFEELDPEGRLMEDYQNELLLFFYEENEEKFWEYVSKFLGDVEIVDGVPYLIIGSQGELSKLYCDGHRNDLSRDTIEELLDGEYENYGWSWDDLSDNIYRDVIEELTKENLVRLKEYIVENLEGEEVETHTELLEDYAEQQGQEYVKVDQSNVDQIVDDEETMRELLENELSDLKSELYGIYSSAYQSAYEDELYEDVWSELSGYFDIEKRQWVSRPHIYKKDVEVQNFRVPIHNFETNILDFLNDNKGYHNGTLEYWGSYISILADMDDCLSVHPPDYPDSRKVDKNINSYFNDYI